MADRIKALTGGSISASNSGSPIEQIRASTAASASTSGAPASVDSVQITDSARQLAALSQAVQNTPEVDSQRVAVLQQAIEGGQYSVNPQLIADRLLQFEHDLSSAAT